MLEVCGVEAEGVAALGVREGRMRHVWGLASDQNAVLGCLGLAQSAPRLY